MWREGHWSTHSHNASSARTPIASRGSPSYKCKVGSRRKIKNVEAGLAAHYFQAAIHRQMLEAMAVYEKQLEADREFEEYRSQLLQRYGG